LSQGSRLGSSVRGAFDTRGASRGADRSGAPSRRARLSVLALAIAALALLALAPLAQAKVVVGGFGIATPVNNPNSSGLILALGGQFKGSPTGIAVNTSGNGASAGTTYVVDNSGNRVERFSSSGSFQRLWGQNVIAPSLNETQQLTVDATGGTFTLSFGGHTTDPIAFDPDPNAGFTNAGAIDAALAALPSVNGSANVSAFTPYNNSVNGTVVVTFTGALAATDQPQLTADTSQLDGSLRISTLVDGHLVPSDTGAGFEVCTAAADCQAGSISGTSANGGQLNNPQGVAINQSNGHVYVTENGNRRVSEFDPNGNFIRAFGWDVISSGKPNDNGTGFEICDTTAAIPDAITDCKQGASGANAGEFSSSGIQGLAVDSSGNVWVADSGNRRIQKFDSTGHFLAAYGYDVIPTGKPGDTGVGLEACPASASATSGNCRAGQTTNGGANPGQFGTSQPSDLAFDSAGNLYAIDSINNQAAHQRVEKFDVGSGYTTASNFATSTFANYTSKGPTHVVATQGGTRLDFSLVNDVSGGGEFQIVELDPTSPATPTDTSLVGAGLTTSNPNTLNGLAYNSTTGNLYVSSGIEAAPRSVLVLNSTPNLTPAVTVKPPSNVTDTSADFSASVDPQGGLLGNCKFQYSTDQLNWTDVNEPDCSSLATSGIQLLGEHALGLTPNTHYYLRFQASRPLVPGSTVNSAVKAFDTASVPPVVSDIGAIQVADTSARLVGTIDPRNSATGYVFEYGTTPALGHTTEPLDVGSGSTPITVSQLVSGLSKDTTYYFKLVATNGFGSTSSDQSTLHTRTVPFPPASPGSCPNEAVRIEQGTTYLPDCRAYEMVTPPDKNQGGAPQGPLSVVFAAADGNRAGVCTESVFGDPPGQMGTTCASYLSVRTPSGWQTTNPFPPYCHNDTAIGLNAGDIRYFISPNLDSAVLYQPEFAGCPLPHPLVPGAPEPAWNVYREDLTAAPYSYDLLADQPNGAIPQSTLSGPTVDFEGASEGFSHVIYTSHSNQTADSPTPEDLSAPKLYDWHDGSPTLISRDTADQPFTTASGLPEGDAVSRDGRRIYFVNPVAPSALGTEGDHQPCEPGCDLYMSEDDATTYKVSAGECSGGCAPSHSSAYFLWTSASGEQAIFASCDALTDASTPFDSAAAGGGDCPGNLGTAVGGTGLNHTGEQPKLYRWDEGLSPGHRLVDLTVDHEPADGSNPKFKGLIGASSDAAADPESNAAPGNTVYFVAHGQLVAGAPVDESTLKLYRWRWNAGTPSVDYLGPYVTALPNGKPDFGDEGPTFTELPSDPNIFPHFDRDHLSADGRYLSIVSKLRLDPAVDRDADVDVYRWDEAGGWTCISCQVPGAPSTGNADSFFENRINGNSRLFINATITDFVVSSDGQRIVFTTPDALLPGDVNGEAGCPAQDAYPNLEYSCMDVYEWHDGTLSLITPGTSSQRMDPIDVTPGGDIFFDTAQRLLGADVDNGNDIYVARIDGGFPEPPAQPPSCEGESCRGEGTLAANGVGAGTAVFQGPGNPAPKHGKAHKPRKHKKHHKRARHQRANNNRRAGR
jgi:hypothetical protein